jgi:hypothetical protein
MYANSHDTLKDIFENHEDIKQELIEQNIAKQRINNTLIQDGVTLNSTVYNMEIINNMEKER